MSISTTSSGSLEGDFEANSLDIKSNSSGSYKGNIWAVNATLGASSSGDILVKGKVKDFSASASLLQQLMQKMFRQRKPVWKHPAQVMSWFRLLKRLMLVLFQWRCCYL